MGVDEPREEGDLAEVVDAGGFRPEVGEPSDPGDAIPPEENRPVVDGGRRVGDHGAGAEEEGTGYVAGPPPP